MRKLNKTNPEYLAQRAAKGDIGKALRILKRAGTTQPPLAGDELPIEEPRRPSKTSNTIDSPEPLDVQLRFAIANKRLIQISYGGYLRVLKPMIMACRRALGGCSHIRSVVAASTTRTGHKAGNCLPSRESRPL
jgi:hypothetical protein